MRSGRLYRHPTNDRRRSSDASAPTIFTQRLGSLLQRQRQRVGLTQSQLAERADLSLKYVGEVERGESNVTVLTLERIVVVLGWDPWSMFSLDQRPISQAVHQLLLSELKNVMAQLMKSIDWMKALDPAMLHAPSEIPRQNHGATTAAGVRRRGRPRKRNPEI